MAGYRIPGHHDQISRPINVDSGTLSRTKMPKPGVIGSAKPEGAEFPSPSIGGRSGAMTIVCLQRVVEIMKEQTRRYIRTAYRDGHYQTSNRRLQFLSEDRIDAFGHCYMGCKGSRTCGDFSTFILGEGRENAREFTRIFAIGHNSYHEDLFNQRLGRELNRRSPSAHCFDLCYRAVVDGRVRLHGHSNTSDINSIHLWNLSVITIEEHEYVRGWQTVPRIYAHTGNLVY